MTRRVGVGVGVDEGGGDGVRSGGAGRGGAFGVERVSERGERRPHGAGRGAGGLAAATASRIAASLHPWLRMAWRRMAHGAWRRTSMMACCFASSCCRCCSASVIRAAFDCIASSASVMVVTPLGMTNAGGCGVGARAGTAAGAGAGAGAAAAGAAGASAPADGARTERPGGGATTGAAGGASGPGMGSRSMMSAPSSSSIVNAFIAAMQPRFRRRAEAAGTCSGALPGAECKRRVGVPAGGPNVRKVFNYHMCRPAPVGSRLQAGGWAIRLEQRWLLPVNGVHDQHRGITFIQYM